MKTLLAAVNSQYIHSNLAVWQLKANCTAQSGNVLVREYNINQQLKWVYSDIIGEKPDVIAFSCYIWNIDFVLKLAEDLKNALPDCYLVLGGPEVSFDYQALLKNHSYIDAVLVGEGEHTFPALLEQLHMGSTPKLDGLCTKNSPEKTAYITEHDLGALADPYTPEMLSATKGKILYFEGSRGCPFSCSYCLSQLSHGVRYLPMDRIKSTLLRLEQNGVTLLKFVDRTFNCNSERAVEVWRFAAEELTHLKLHFEIGADLVDTQQLAVLSQMPVGRIQLEAGVQSTNPKTLATVCRKTNLEQLQKNSRKIMSFQNIHFHLDLIAGLPHENYVSFSHSFDNVFALHPHQLQLGFLKMLRGSKIRKEAGQYQYRYRSYPPYEIISSHCLSPKDLAKLMKLEETLERYYNSGRFALSLPWLIKKWDRPFRFFELLTDYLEQQGALSQSVAADRQFVMLLSFAENHLPGAQQVILRELLRCDYLLSGLKGALPTALINEAYRYTKPLAEEFYEKNLFAHYGLLRPINKKEMMKQYGFACFSVNPFEPDQEQENVFLIDYTKKSQLSGRYFSLNITQPPLH